MNRFERFDNWMAGSAAAVILIFAIYFFLRALEQFFFSGTAVAHYFFPPKIQLFVLFVMVILFRVAMVNLKMHNFGKGMLAAMVILSFAYYYFIYRKSVLGN